jgi:hypothetical protein
LHPYRTQSRIRKQPKEGVDFTLLSTAICIHYTWNFLYISLPVRRQRGSFNRQPSFDQTGIYASSDISIFFIAKHKHKCRCKETHYQRANFKISATNTANSSPPSAGPELSSSSTLSCYAIAGVISALLEIFKWGSAYMLEEHMHWQEIKEMNMK